MILFSIKLVIVTLLGVVLFFGQRSSYYIINRKFDAKLWLEENKTVFIVCIAVVVASDLVVIFIPEVGEAIENIVGISFPSIEQGISGSGLAWGGVVASFIFQKFDNSDKEGFDNLNN